jgi:hypothetical protein
MTKALKFKSKLVFNDVLFGPPPQQVPNVIREGYVSEKFGILKPPIYASIRLKL